MSLSSCSRLLTAGFVLSGAALAVNHNDECADAAPITPGTPEPFATTLATPSVPDFTASCGAGGGSTSSKDIWFSFTATADYQARATTCGTANYDTKIEVYSGSCGALVTVGCNDDAGGCAGFTSQADFAAVSGTEYFVRIGGWGTTDEGGGFVLVTAPPSAVPNDECADALPITPDVLTSFDTSLASPSAPDFTASCGAGGGSTSSNDVWFSFTATSDYQARATTCGTAAYDSKIEVYSGSCGALVSVGCNDDFAGCAGFTSQADFAAVTGTEYFIRIGGWGTTDAGSGDILLTDVPPPALPNDDCGGAIAIGLGETLTDNVGASAGTEDLDCAFNGEASDVWFTYTAIGNCPVTVDLAGSSFDTAMKAYEGSCSTLFPVACNDDATGLQSLVTWQADPGTTYFIQVGGFNGATGDIVMNVSEGLGSVVCAGNANSTGVGALLRACGSDTVADNAMTLEVTDLPANQNVLFVNSQETILVANPGGSQGDLCIGSLALGRHVNDIVNSGSSGQATLSLDLANVPTNLALTAVVAGETWYWQAWYRDVDGGGAATSNLSSAVGVTFN